VNLNARRLCSATPPRPLHRVVENQEPKGEKRIWWIPCSIDGLQLGPEIQLEYATHLYFPASLTSRRATAKEPRVVRDVVNPELLTKNSFIASYPAPQTILHESSDCFRDRTRYAVSFRGPSQSRFILSCLQLRFCLTREGSTTKPGCGTLRFVGSRARA
jgi:hypothetical protein